MKPSKSTADLAAEHARLAAQLAERRAQEDAAQDAADRAAFEAAQTRRAEDRTQAEKDYADTEAAVVETVVELSGLLSALEERRKMALTAGAPIKDTLTSGLAQTVKAVRHAWQMYRPELVGNPPKEDPRDTVVREARSEVELAKQRLADLEAKLADRGLQRGGPMEKEYRRQLTMWADGLALRRQRLATALQAKGDTLTTSEYRELLDLTEAGPVMVTIRA